MLPTNMEHWTSKLDVTKMTRTFAHGLSTGLTLEIAVNGSHAWVHQTTHFLPLSRLVHDLRKFNLGD